MLLLTSKLWIWVIVVLNSYETLAGSKCSKHIIEDVRQYSTEVNVEVISFNAIITGLLSLVQSAQLSHFSIFRENFISAQHHICLNSGSGLEIGTVQYLQTFRYSGTFLLSVKWVNGQLMVFSNSSNNALFLNEEEIKLLLDNYRLTNIQKAHNSHLFLEGTTINLYRPENKYICQAG